MTAMDEEAGSLSSGSTGAMHGPAGKRPDFNIFSMRDVSDIALQRTDALGRVPGFGAVSFRAWRKGISAPLFVESFLRRNRILSVAWDAAQAEWATFRDLLPAGATEICDIGCGHSLIDLAAHYDRPELNFSLVDIERTEAKHHHFAAQGAGYASLQSAKGFLVGNGLQPSQIALCNPRRDPLPEGPFDMIISIISAGFHYPIAEYVPFALKTLKPGAPLIFDMRVDTGQMASLSEFSRTEVLLKTEKFDRIAAFR